MYEWSNKVFYYFFIIYVVHLGSYFVHLKAVEINKLLGDENLEHI